MSLNRRALRARVAFAGALLFALGAAALYRQHRARAASHFVPPVLVDPKPGPRAPSTDLLGVRVGVSHFDAVVSLVTRSGLSCEDRGVRVLMAEIRDKKRAEVAEAAARGTPDAVSGASILTRRTARDENPQIRFSCEGADSSKLVDRARASSKGRLLFVFDDPKSPLRNASYQRNFSDFGSALADFSSALDAFTARFGTPRETELGPRRGPSPDSPLEKYSRRVDEWRFADVVATVSIANLGGRGFVVSESLEVPLPLRADAPTR